MARWDHVCFLLLFLSLSVIPDPDRESRGFAVFMRGFAPTRRGSFDPSTSSGLRTGSFVSAKGPKTIGARAWPHGVPLPQSRFLGLPSTSGALRLTLRMNGLSLPVHASLPFVLSVTEWSRRKRSVSEVEGRSDSPRLQPGFGTGAQPRPKAPG